MAPSHSSKAMWQGTDHRRPVCPEYLNRCPANTPQGHGVEHCLVRTWQLLLTLIPQRVESNSADSRRRFKLAYQITAREKRSMFVAAVSIRVYNCGCSGAWGQGIVAGANAVYCITWSTTPWECATECLSIRVVSDCTASGDGCIEVQCKQARSEQPE